MTSRALLKQISACPKIGEVLSNLKVFKSQISEDMMTSSPDGLNTSAPCSVNWYTVRGKRKGKEERERGKGKRKGKEERERGKRKEERGRIGGKRGQGKTKKEERIVSSFFVTLSNLCKGLADL
jgi:hypothetical protein